MQHIPKWMTLLIIGFLFIAVAAVYVFQSYRYHDVSKLMKQSAQVVMTESMDRSSRTNDESTILSEETFEQRFKDRFEELKAGYEVKSYSFKYRKEGDLYKSVKIKIIDDQDSPHEVTWATDMSQK
jgi:hypothetical protein